MHPGFLSFSPVVAFYEHVFTYFNPVGNRILAEVASR